MMALSLKPFPNVTKSAGKFKAELEKNRVDEDFLQSCCDTVAEVIGNEHKPYSDNYFNNRVIPEQR